MKWFRALSILPKIGLLFAVLTLGCGAEPEADPRPLGAGSVLPQKQLVERIAGERVRTALMIPAGANPTSYSPTLANLQDLSEADLYIKVGHPNFPFEKSWLKPLLEEREDLLVVDCSEKIAAPEVDPHIWVTPQNASAIALIIKNGLTSVLPAEQETFEQNLGVLLEELAALDQEIRGHLADRQSDTFFVLHPAWGYFAQTYGLEQVAIERDHKSPDPRRLALIIDQARRENTRYILVQPQFNPDPARTVANAIGAEVIVIDPLAYDWPESLRQLSRSMKAEREH
ncbi:zinc ABC transporter substrate-binding protein [Myxococcota bacterium]|nr:zinc ABC transporter substrate-binding protein [Myxococcota bacterium]